jgi:ABC-2 type transport system permease protein
MANNGALELVDQRGWRRGLDNLLDKEFGRWFRTRRWWSQALVWLGIIGFLMGTIILQSGTDSDNMVLIFGIFASIFPAVAVIIQMQSALVGEKASGTAAWVLSKPVSRPAFIISKLVGNALVVLLVMVLIPDILAAYPLLSYAMGHLLTPLRFLAGLMVIWLSLLYYLSFTLMLGAFFKNRGAVIGLALGMLFMQQYLFGLTPLFKVVLPWTLTVPVSGGDALLPALLQGQALKPFVPQVLFIIAEIALFVGLAIWRFNKEEF